MTEQKQIQKKILSTLSLKTSEENFPLLCCCRQSRQGVRDAQYVQCAFQKRLPFEVKRQFKQI